MTCPRCLNTNTAVCWDCWDLQSQTSTETASRLPEDTLMCPKPGCQRHKPFENAEGRLECWWCGHVGDWHDFPPVPNAPRSPTSTEDQLNIPF